MGRLSTEKKEQERERLALQVLVVCSFLLFLCDFAAEKKEQERERWVVQVLVVRVCLRLSFVFSFVMLYTYARALVTSILVLCTLLTQFSRSICNSVSTVLIIIIIIVSRLICNFYFLQ
jgi:hypothetical protein